MQNNNKAMNEKHQQNGKTHKKQYLGNHVYLEMDQKCGKNVTKKTTK